MRGIVALLAACGVVAAQPRAGELRIYVMDVEGGNATRFVTPAGESVLIDTANGGEAGSRDAERIVAAVKDAGLSQIDHLNNGTRKGGQPSTMQILYTAPRLQDLWQMHFSELSRQEYTVPGVFIANGIDNQPPSMPIAAASQPPAAAGGPPFGGPVPARPDGRAPAAAKPRTRSARKRSEPANPHGPSTITTLPGPWIPSVSVSSMSPVRLGPVMNVHDAASRNRSA